MKPCLSGAWHVAGSRGQGRDRPIRGAALAVRDALVPLLVTPRWVRARTRLTWPAPPWHVQWWQ